MKHVVLLSAGMDSVVNLYLAREKGEVEAALTFDYGQRAAERELERAAAVCAALGTEHVVLRIPWLGGWSSCALTNPDRLLPRHAAAGWFGGGADLEASAEAVWVPNRNGVFVNLAAALAEARGAELVVAGFNAEEAATFPDNSAGFVEEANRALLYSTRGKVRLVSYTLHMDKAEIAVEGKRLGIPWKKLWSCYNGNALMCGECESCARLRRAAGAAGLEEELAGAFSREGNGLPPRSSRDDPERQCR
jgi:7-cyano-7-deazaguanine synthase